MKRREFNKGLAAATAVSLSPFSLIRSARAAAGSVRAATVAGGATPVFDYSNGFAGASGIQISGDAVLRGSVINLINTGGHNACSVFYNAQQPPTAFTTQFTFQPTGLGSGIAQSGMTFCIQNTTEAQRNAAGYGYYGIGYYGDANMCGYGGGITQFPPPDSLAIKFDAGNESIGQGYPAGGHPSSTGMYFNGGPSAAYGSIGLVPFNDLHPYGINFYNDHVFQVTIVYDGSLLTMVILDSTTNAQARFAWPLNLANTTNASGNWVGFTAGTAAVGLFKLSSWSYWSGYNPRLATPTFSLAPGQYSGTQTLTLSYPPGSSCYYTTNGLLPTSSSTQYSGPITVGASQVIQAVAIQSGFTDSLVAIGAYQINTANVINFPAGFSAGSLVNVGYAYLSGSAYCVSDNTQVTSGAVWFPAPVVVSSFSTTFTLRWGGNGQGMCFVIQNNPAPYNSNSGALNWSGGPTVVGAASGALGYGGLNDEDSQGGGATAYGLQNSVAIAFNQYAFGSVPGNSVALCTNGSVFHGPGAGNFMSTGLSFGSGHPFNVTLSYSGSALSFTMTDTVTGASFTHTFTIDIPTTVGASTAIVGFTGGTGGAASVQAIQSWTFTASAGQTPIVPAAPTNLHVK